ncbi:MAG: hypothetical protein ACK5PG_02645 [Lysobacterales bacterium]
MTRALHGHAIGVSVRRLLQHQFDAPVLRAALGAGVVGQWPGVGGGQRAQYLAQG